MKSQAVCQYVHDNRSSYLKYSCITGREKQKPSGPRGAENFINIRSSSDITFQWGMFFVLLLFLFFKFAFLVVFWLTFLSAMPCFLSNEHCLKFLKAFCKGRVSWQQWWISLVIHSTATFPNIVHQLAWQEGSCQNTGSEGCKWSFYPF